MKSTQTVASVACGLIVSACAVISLNQVARLLGHVAAWERRQPVVPAFGAVDIVYFTEPTCPACQAASPAIARVQHSYPHYRIARVDTSTPAGIALQEEYNRAYHVPREDRDKIPVAFAGQRYFVGVDDVTKGLPAYLNSNPPVRPARQLRPSEGGRTILVQQWKLTPGRGSGRLRLRVPEAHRHPHAGPVAALAAQASGQQHRRQIGGGHAGSRVARADG